MFKKGDKVIITQCCHLPCDCNYEKVGTFNGFAPSKYSFVLTIKDLDNDSIYTNNFYKIVPYNELTEVLYL